MRSPYLQACVIESLCVGGRRLPTLVSDGWRRTAGKLALDDQRNGIFRNTSQSHKAFEVLDQVAQKHALNHTAMSQAKVYKFEGVTPTIHWPHQNGNHS